MSDRKHISSSNQSNGNLLSAEELQAYLEGTLPPERQHAVEQWLEKEGMESDAMEGLMEIEADEMKQRVAIINHQLQRQLGAGRNRRKRPITENKWAWIAVAIVLFLCLLGYAIIAITQ